MIRLVQVTDPHIGATPDYRLAGVDTRRTFGEVMDRVGAEKADLLLMTGDNAADYSEQAYEHFFGVMQTFEQPYYWIPGNHDKISAAESVPGGKPFQRSVELDAWQLIFLDSVIPRSPDGQLGLEELVALENCLSKSTSPNIAIFLHHHPVEINCAWLDQQRVKDADQFFAIVDRYPQIRAIFWGHIHQEFNSQYGDIKLHSCPSTCIQFLPDSDDFALDTQFPGYRVIELNDDGSLNTYVERVEILDMGIDENCLGYE